MNDREVKSGEYEAAYLSHPGPSGATNEDYALADCSIGIFAVADGMGGRPGGDQASKIAVESLAEYLRSVSPETRLNGAVLDQAVLAANTSVRKLADCDPLLSGSGTTLSAVVLLGRFGRIVHVGDSRIYIYRGNELHRLTEDHTLANDILGEGKGTSASIGNPSLRNMLSRSVGTEPHVQADIRALELLPRDTFLLCTDGLVRSINEERICEVLRDERSCDIAWACGEIVQNALLSSPKDNLTLLIMRRNKAE